MKSTEILHHGSVIPNNAAAQHRATYPCTHCFLLSVLDVCM